MYHESVLLREAIEGLKVINNGVYVDVTYGGGGHTKKILEKVGSLGKVFAFDQDEEAFNNQIKDDRLIMIHQNFKYISNYLNFYSQSRINGLIADLGVSSYQINKADRGFSFMNDATLDMRMDRELNLTAQDVVNGYEQERLTDMFKKYGELSNAKKIANEIITARTVKKITSTFQLVSLLKKLCPIRFRNKFFARVFQAIRIEVNQELKSLEVLLEQSISLLKKGGRIVVISYHSLEDRIVKNFFKTGNIKGVEQKDFFGNKKTVFKIITKKPIQPGEKEIKINPRARSAKMRIAELTI